MKELKSSCVSQKHTEAGRWKHSSNCAAWLGPWHTLNRSCQLGSSLHTGSGLLTFSTAKEYIVTVQWHWVRQVLRAPRRMWQGALLCRLALATFIWVTWGQHFSATWLPSELISPSAKWFKICINRNLYMWCVVHHFVPGPSKKLILYEWVIEPTLHNVFIIMSFVIEAHAIIWIYFIARGYKKSGHLFSFVLIIFFLAWHLTFWQANSRG